MRKLPQRAYAKRPHPKQEADTAKASQRDALGSLLGTFSSEKVRYPHVTKERIYSK